MKEAAQFTEGISNKLKTPKDTAFFWSGNTDGVGGKEKAIQIAKSKGGTTLEKLTSDREIVMPNWEEGTLAQEKWKFTSAEYARQASGKVYVVLGESVRADSVWLTYELPTLKQNPNVSQIIRIDPKTLVETVIYTRG